MNETYQDLESIYNKTKINSMKNQFFYKQKRQTTPQEGDTESRYEDFRDSFNINKVVRTGTYPDGSVAVYLDDFIERSEKVPDINPKTNKMAGYKNLRQTTQSEIILTKEDGDRFFKLTNIE